MDTSELCPPASGKPSPETRQPTHQEAVEWLLRSLTIEYRRECLGHWRGIYGNLYADQIQAEVEKRWKTRK